MNIKETFSKISTQKKTIVYWLILFAIINVAAAIPQIVSFVQSGQCRNYLQYGSELQICSASQFVKYGWSWVSVVTLFLLVPAAAFMTLVRNFVNETLAPKKD